MRNAYLLLFIFLVGCKSDSKTDSEKGTPEGKDKIITNLSDEAVNRLYMHYVDAPSQQSQKDENAIIEYAVAKSLDLQRTNSGLYYIIHERGPGPNYIRNQPCRVHYRGFFLNGKIFDSSYQKDRPIDFYVGGMNAGWNEGLLLMNTGTKAQLFLPSRLAYGERGFPGYVPPNTPIAFDMHCLPLN
jgi:FKBP-type peptidyl-prolyl cis-trans isomerase